MFIPKIEISLTPREDAKPYAVDINQKTLDILSLIFEFKIATAPHIARFLKQPEQSKYLYLKLRRMWQAGLLESLQVSVGTRQRGMPVYYMLGKSGLAILAERLHLHKTHFKSYPSAVSFIASGLFKHEAEIVELASLEAKNNSEKLAISFIGETASLAREVRSDKRIEVLTPDYIVSYTMNGVTELVYTEFERTNKSPVGMLKKIDRYVKHLGTEENEHTTLRIIFENENMEESFWLNILLNKSRLLQSFRIVTTNTSYTKTSEQFLGTIYATAETVELKRDGRVTTDLSERVRLFSFL
jgi:hypothetical protein